MAQININDFIDSNGNVKASKKLITDLISSNNVIDTKTQNLPTDGSFKMSNYMGSSTQTFTLSESVQYMTLGLPVYNKAYKVSATIVVDGVLVKFGSRDDAKYGTVISLPSDSSGDTSITINSLGVHASLETFVVGFSTTSSSQYKGKSASVTLGYVRLT